MIYILTPFIPNPYLIKEIAELKMDIQIRLDEHRLNYPELSLPDNLKKCIKNQSDLYSEFNDIVNDNFQDLI